MSELTEFKERERRNRDRRIYERYGLEAPQGNLKHNGRKLPCHVIDVSLGGCCLRTKGHFLAGNLAQVEVEMSIHGMLLRMSGITQWTSRNNLVGVRFIHPSQRSKNQLAGLLTCLVDKSAADVVAAAMAEAAAAPSSEQALDLEIPEDLLKNFMSSEASEQEPKTAQPPQVPSSLEGLTGTEGGAARENGPPADVPAPDSSDAAQSDPAKPPEKRPFGVHWLWARSA